MCRLPLREMLGLSELLSNQQLRLGDLLAARAAATPDAPALVAADGSALTHAGLQAEIAAARAALEAAGLAPGDRLLLEMASGVPALALLLGALDLGAVVVPIATERPAAERAALRTLCEPRLVATVPAAGTPAFAPGPGGALEETGLPAGRQAALIVFPPAPRPRGVVLGHRGLAWNAAIVAQERRHGPGDHVLVAAPLAEPAVLTEVLGLLQAGGACELAAAPTPAALGAAIGARGVTGLLAPAALLEALAAEGDAGLAGNRLRVLAASDVPVAEEAAGALEALLGLAPQPGHAAPESGPLVAFARPGQTVPAGSVGAPLPGVELRIVDAAGQAVAPGRVGELLVRSAGVMLGCWRDPAATAAAFASGRFLRSLCLARRDAEGYVTILGRLREAILRGGFSVHPTEIEALLERLPGVARSSVLGHHNGHDEELLAFVQPREGEARPDPAAIAAALARQLAPYKRPSRILVVPSLPLGPGGEVQTARLLELLG